jgi:hypothetical protein
VRSAFDLPARLAQPPRPFVRFDHILLFIDNQIALPGDFQLFETIPGNASRSRSFQEMLYA